MKTCLEILIGAWKFESVHQKIEFFRIVTLLGASHHILDPYGPVCEETGISLLLELEHKLDLICSGTPVKFCKDVQCTVILLRYVFKDIVCRMAFHLFPCYRRICTADPCIYHTEIVIYLRAGRNGRPRVPRVHLLLYGYRRRYALYQFHIRLRHPSEELTRI